MNPEQEHAIRLLQELLQPQEKRNTRNTALLCRTESLEEYRRISEEEFCRGWSYRLGPHFAEALDLSLDRRVKKKIPYFVWTQGSAFKFKAGYVLHKADGSVLIQIQEAQNAVPAKGGIKRDPGMVRLQFYIPGQDGRLWQKGLLTDMSQDDFVRYLITGKR
ncbi:hypothetical protein LJC15_00090 [Desulfovibrio sp. OttesenSCG-928-G11]|nr:hypothetical protein [Desulfovibrio sp. OttesenSCG-928-G11]